MRNSGEFYGEKNTQWHFLCYILWTCFEENNTIFCKCNKSVMAQYWFFIS